MSKSIPISGNAQQTSRHAMATESPGSAMQLQGGKNILKIENNYGKLPNPLATECSRSLFHATKRLMATTHQKNPPELSDIDRKKKEDLFLNVELANANKLRGLIAAGIAPAVLNSVNYAGTPLLIKAIYAGSRKVIDALLHAPGINPAARGKNGRTPLMAAVLMGDLKTINKLLSMLEPWQVNAAADDGRTALRIACEVDHRPVVEQLMKIPKIDLNAALVTDGTTALYWVIKNGSKHLIELLLKADDIRIHDLDRYNNTALMVAVARNSEAILALVLKKIAGDVNVLNAASVQGTTAVHVAALLDRQDMLKTLLQESGIKLNLGTIYGETPIALAKKQQHEAIVKMLEDAQRAGAVHGSTDTASGHGTRKVKK